jgi:hypothetical protein
MDAVAAVTTSKNAIDALKWVPIWLLASITLVGTVFLLVPALQAPLPEGLKLWLPPAAVFLWVLIVCKTISDLGSDLNFWIVRTTESMSWPR